jgi:tetratricopeptide (TPR) repeat protein
VQGQPPLQVRKAMTEHQLNDKTIPGAAPTAALRPLAARPGPSPLVWLMLGVLILLALAVIFVLPGVVAEYELPLTPRAQVEQTQAPATATAPTLNPVSPFEEAQRARQRQEAQEVLSSLLERQTALEDLQVSQWAQQAYDAALGFARTGDEAYRTQAFDQATEQYRNADTALARLQDSIPEVLASALARGNAALEAGDATLATEAFALALLLQPGDAAAQSGMQRAATLDQVNALLARADAQRTAGELDAARTALEEALALDGAHAQARSQLDQVRQAISDNAFTRVMSTGFAALQTGDTDAAIAAFEQALVMRPGNPEAQEAITQTRDQLAVSRINAHREAAQTQVAAEQWEAAVAEYDAALAIDAALVFAIDGRDYAAKRLQLDRLLQDAIDQPARLADTAVHAQAVQVYYTGLALENPGPRLQQQLTQVEGLLARAQVPVEVQLLSDNLTEVTLYQVGVLGRFQSQTLSLKPGRYVAVGTRPGYRDVRTEFDVGFDNRSTPVTVACTEEIVAVNRR